MKAFRFIPLPLMAVMAAACSGDGAASGPEAARNITIEATIGTMTRATTTGSATVFDEGDSVSVYAWTGTAEAVTAERAVDGVVNTLGADGTWTPAVPMLWADMVSVHYFLGICPARTVTDFTADPFTLDPADYEASDLLAALQLSGLTATQNPVSLTFDHVMARLDVNMNFRNQWDGAPSDVSCEAQAVDSCTIDYLARSVAPGAPSSVPLPAVPAAAGYAATFSGIMIPQQGFRTVVLTIEGQRYVYTHTEDIPLEAGRYTTLNLIVGRNKIEVGEVSINDWTEGATISGGQAL